MKRHLACALAALSLVLASGCETTGGEESGSVVAARIGDEVVTIEELDQEIKDDLFARESKNGNASRLYDLRSRALRGVLLERVLSAEAEAKGQSQEDFIQETFPLPEVDDAQVQSFYAENASRLRGAPLEQVAPQIRQHLQQEVRQEAIEAYVAQRTTIELERERVAMRSGGPSKGPDDAAVTIVEFSDFQCPYCQRAVPVLEEMLRRYPEDVRVVYRHLPLDSIHPQARPGAEAAACAGDAGKFWPYHDLLFANNRNLGPDDLRTYAEQVGLDVAEFDECLASRRHAQAVEADVREARSLGITGTPAFVVNGIVLFGLQSVEALDEIVRSELAKDAS